jgi:hypothetical protein
MMSWMSGYPSAYSKAGPYHLLTPFPATNMRRLMGRRKEPLPDQLPDYMLFVTKNSLVALTDSLADASIEAHCFFARLNYTLAMDRMVRGFMAWTVPGAMAQQSNPYALQSWIPSVPNAGPRPISFAGMMPHRDNGAAKAADATQSVATACAALLSIPAAFINAAPAIMEAWRTAETAA